ncbi:hypothetical protein MYX07_03660 [Patescibacteria group bacterium AH-259-L07]|nr:hypothetical protein [Patescibacteria group bacterium AH-259-L07]
MKPSKVVKIQTYCPKDAADEVRLAIGKAGGGVIGNYTYCAFLTNGHGYSLPMEGSTPTIGKQGEIKKIEEIKIEFLCEQNKVKNVIRAIKKACPYEEVPIDIFQLLDLE